MGFKWFNTRWLFSTERKQLLKERIAEQDLKNALLSKKIEEKEQQATLPYKKIIYNGENITVILQDNTKISKNGISNDLFLQMRGAATEGLLIRLLEPSPKLKTEQNAYTPEEIKEVSNSAVILKDNPDFEFEGNNIYLKNVKLPLVPIVLATFIEILEKEEVELSNKYEALKNFWMWLALNPIESSRQDCLTFVKNNDISINQDGMLELYRKVVNVGNKDKALVEFISEQYFKIKKWKKAPSSYEVFKIETGDERKMYKLGKCEDFLNQEYIAVLEGNLEELYLNIPNMVENIYTDNHTHSKIIKIGQIYREDEDNIDLDNSRSCSRGLHLGSRSFGFDSFGDTGVMALVNPSKVRSVPNHESNKMRVSEMFIVGTVDFEDYENHIDSGDLISYSSDYSVLSIEELEEQLKNKTFDKLSCQENIVSVPISNVVDIKNALKARIVNI